MNYSPEELNRKLDNIEGKVEELVEEEMEEHCDKHHKDSTYNIKGNNMDIAGLLALMQNNKGLSLADIKAATEKEGGFAGGGLGIVVLLLFFLMMNNGGFGNNANRTAAADMAATAGLDLQTITSLYDRNAATLQAVNAGFSSGQTALCSSIAEVIGSVRNQGDRISDNLNAFSSRFDACCCATQRAIDSVKCSVETSELRNQNALQSMECRLSNQIEKSAAATALGFERTNCHIDSCCKDTEIARLTRENSSLKATSIADCTADNVVRRLERFAVHHYTPTTTGAAA